MIHICVLLDEQLQKTVSVDLTLPLIALDPGKPFLDLNFQVCSKLYVAMYF